MESDPIYLLIDAGNTRIKWALHDGERHRVTGAIATADSAKLASAWRDVGRVQRAVASNVAGDGVRADLESACAEAGLALEVIRPEPEQLGVRNGYTQPTQLGSDRWAALLAAHATGPGAKLVVTAGTALTIDALAADGRFLGGLIAPGPALMRRALDRGTAGLRLTEGTYDDFPRSTPDAITSGAVHAAVGAIERMARVIAQAGHAPARVLLSGGAAAEIAPHLPFPAAIHENLVLDGLALLARTR